MVAQYHEDDMKVTLLTRAGSAIGPDRFPLYLELVDRFPDLTDRVLYGVVSDASFCGMNKRELFDQAYAQNWIRTAIALLEPSDGHRAVELLVRSKFAPWVIGGAKKRIPELFDNFSLCEMDKDRIRFEDEFSHFLRGLFIEARYIEICEVLPEMESSIRRFVLQSRREFVDIDISDAIKGLEKCTRQQLIILEILFEDLKSWDLLFCVAYCLRDFAKCVECVEKQGRMMRRISDDILRTIGFYNK
jgi:hypothetical protein